MGQQTSNSILKKALNQLPNHEPSDAIWSTLEKELDGQSKLQTLPTYEPSDGLWAAIETDLPTKRSSIFWLKRISLAASVLLILGVFYTKFTATTTVQISYHQEEIKEHLLLNDWEEDGDVVAEIEAICSAQKYLCSAADFQSLQEELTELEMAKSELKTALDNYGKDIALIAQLSEIELERTSVLKKIMAQLL